MDMNYICIQILFLLITIRDIFSKSKECKKDYLDIDPLTSLLYESN